MSLSHPRCTSCMMWPMVMLCMDRTRVSLHTIDCLTLFRFTLTPRGGDSDNISHRAKNLLVQMASGKRKFVVMEFIWNEIVTCASDPSSACHYAPYIFHMIKWVTQLNILHSTIHSSYRSTKGKIEQALHIGSHGTSITPLGPFSGCLSIQLCSRCFIF